MTRRFVLAIVGTVVATLLLAGLGTFVIGQARARRVTETELRRQAAALAEQASEDDTARAQRLLAALQLVLRLQDVGRVTIGPAGRVVGTPPAGVTVGDLDAARLMAGQVVSGHHRSLVYAAAAIPSARATTPVLVLTRRADAGLRFATTWFLWSAAFVVVLGVGVAVALSRRLTRPIRDADEATRRIAAGELSTRIAEDERHDDELANLVRSINTMAATLERAKGLEQQFLLSVSHDLRTPLTSIRGYAEAITDGATKDPQWAAGVILTEAARLERLVRDLLDLAKLESRSFSLHIDNVDLAAVARAGVEAVAHDEDEVRVSFAGESVTVQADRDRLGQVVANLVDNARKFARSSVVVSVARQGDRAWLSVDDDGPGIPDADLPYVFERLYVAHREPTRRESGSGLGLAIVRELVRAMGGEVGAHRSPSGGARLAVSLPTTTPLPPPAPAQFRN
jgi:two-component system sensor histidine kinase BaeS